MKRLFEGLLLCLAIGQFVLTALPPGNADLISIQSLACDFAHGEDRLLYPGRGFENNDQWVRHHALNLRRIDDAGEPNWCFYPPIVPYVMSPLAEKSASSWRLTWGGLQFLMVVAMILIMARLMALYPGRRPLNWLLLIALVVGSYPLARSFELGQTSLFVALLLWTGLYGAWKGKILWPALLCGAAILVKPFLLLAVVPLVLYDRVRAFVGILLAVLGASVAAVLVMGLPVHLDYWTFLSTLASSQTAYYGNQSLFAALLRMFSDLAVLDYGFARDPALDVLGKGISLFCLGLAAWAQWRGRDRNAILSVGLWLSAVLIALPISWEHHLVLLLPVVALLWTRDRSLPATIALGVATALMAINATSLYSESFSGRIAANIAVAGNLILFVMLLHYHISVKPVNTAASGLREGEDARS